MKLEGALVLIGCFAVSGCSLKDMLAKADAGAAAADSGASASAVADAAPASVAADAVNDAGAVTAKNAGAVTAKPKNALPTCPKGQLLGTVALSPFKPFCGAPCKTQADCKGGAFCEDVNALASDGGRPKGPEFIKICNAETAAATASAPSSKPSASAPAAAAPAAPKCGPNQHFDDINKKCRAFGDCPAGFRWNDPMKSCINDG